MTHYIDGPIVKNEENDKIYKVTSYEAYDLSSSIQLNLNLICGLLNGNWVSAEKFDDDAQEELVIQYFLSEGAREALEANDYTIIETLPEYE